MDFDLLTEIVEAFKQYQLSLSAGSRSSIIDFSIWISRQHYNKGESKSGDHSDIIGRNDIDVELGKLIIYVNRYARLLIRKGLSGFPELINEDFTYLYTLMAAQSMTKIQLIEKNVHEKPTGLEVIKRLLKHKLIAEKVDEHDKRSKRVFLTEMGKATFFRSIEQMGKVSKIIAGNLSATEKKQLFTLLKKLEDFHNPIFLNEKLLTINELSKKVDIQH
jgi:DNA-binding MarR family transcriptional regulator